METIPQGWSWNEEEQVLLTSSPMAKSNHFLLRIVKIIQCSTGLSSPEGRFRFPSP